MEDDLEARLAFLLLRVTGIAEVGLGYISNHYDSTEEHFEETRRDQAVLDEANAILEEYEKKRGHHAADQLSARSAVEAPGGEDVTP